MANVNITIPDKLQFLFQPARYKVAHGGRGSGKSHSFARALLLLGAQKKLRILCTREVQNSIKDSVHKLLKDLISSHGLGGFYEPLETVIRGKNGTEFLFSGLSSQTAESLKSYEGVDICWCEEGQVVSKKSWDILTPTIRAPGSEIWISMNPILDTDETYTRFITKPPPNSVVVQVNYSDNPWFPDVLEQERLHCKATASLEDYLNIWEGQCRSAVSGAIYANEVALAAVGGRICRLPYDPALKVHTVWDLGFGDNMCVVMVQRTRSEIRLIDYEQVNQMRTDECVALIQKRLYNWGYDFLPHDGAHHERKTGLSDADILRKMGRRVRMTPNLTVETGIRMARNVFGRCVFDKDKTSDLLECLKRYRRAETRTGGDGSPVHDAFSHGADAFRYMALNVERMTNDEMVTMPQFEVFTPFNNSMGY